jgi:hypothetical protein
VRRRYVAVVVGTITIGARQLVRRGRVGLSISRSFHLSRFIS